MITFDHVNKRYASGQDALARVSLEIPRGDMVFLTGHSGAGKSTLLRLLTAIERPTKGTILVAGQNLNRLRNHQIPYYRRNLGIVFQNHQLLSDRSVFDNIALPLAVTGCNRREVGRRVRAALDKVGLLHKEKQNPMVLSGGEQQRVGIARAVVNKPAILVADEPTGNLDSQLSREIMQLFADFNAVGVTVLVASHDLELVAQMCQRVLTLQEGQLIYDGVPNREVLPT
ncbi:MULTISPECIES: cell division ATP-binding protein FtsE [unclassified Microbulbifer]|uniref:Cell division ATP-binding protein FtsE n=1 Tax=Microbulbifer spongiae TaxID=2944933 RepID=A0ABY9E9R5_9GAMM|nr:MULTISPECIES: cell division ATP-binding protein FtsE [unclassified Microbulbifer]MDP5210487.1 cell division ATP-binding protein FtsE [Microbulbifer sp. 2205BS26-8]WKD49794.1 cell division ATP-binding protein FtsE [Microbulbifer sp. MI-G]